MPISSGAGGKAARLHLPVGSKHSYWPANAAGASKSQSTSIITISNIANDHQEPNRDQSASISKSSSNLSSSAGSIAATSKDSHLNAANAKNRMRGPATSKQPANRSPHEQQRLATVEKYKRIRHISPPSSHATTSPTAFKYFADSRVQEQDKLDYEDQNRSPNSEMSSPAGQRQQQQQEQRKKLTSTLGDFDVLTTTSHDLTSAKTASKSGLFGSLMMLAGANNKASTTQSNSAPANASTNINHSRPTMKRSSQNVNSAGHYPSATTTIINQHHTQAASQTSLNPSLSPYGASSAALAASNSSSTAHLNSLSCLHQQPPTTTINKRINLKYVKTLIIVLMSLDLMITLFVHHFASHDEFSLIFTSHKLRLSLVNLILSAIWFIVLISAILFDIYFILIIGCLVDVASFILLLTCSIIHFTHRIDYNTVNLTSLLLLLFSITVLHVYLLVMAALTIYLMLAVKRRRNH